MPRINRLALARALQAADQQDGVLTLAQFAEAGVPASTVIRRARAGGPWQRLLPATYALYSGPPSPEAMRRAALLYTGPGSVLTGATALRLLGVRTDLPEPPVPVLIAASRDVRAREFVDVVRTRRLPEPIAVAGIPVAPLARAVVDAARGVRDPRTVDALVGEVVQRRLCTPEALAAEVRRAQLRGTALIRAAVAAAMEGAVSGPEAELGRHLKLAGLPTPHFNVSLCDAESGLFLARPDAYWEIGVAVEVDSRRHHSFGGDFDRTLDRDALLTSYGILTLHVTPTSLRNDPARFMRLIAETLEIALRTPAPRVVVRRGDR